jgi:hypothetical protein
VRRGQADAGDDEPHRDSVPVHEATPIAACEQPEGPMIAEASFS